MKLTINRNTLVKPLQQVSGAVEKRQTMPALANVLLESFETGFSLTATDLEITLKASIEYPIAEQGRVTLPAKKLLDICKSLPEDADIVLDIKDEKASVTSNKSRFHLICLPAAEFPVLDDIHPTASFAIPQRDLKKLLDKTSFAMANQDVRFFLNGMMLETDHNTLRCVATDGHRLAMAETKLAMETEAQQVIIPRKGVVEMQRLLTDSDELIRLEISSNHIRAISSGLEFTSKLIDGRFPDYKRVLPEPTNNRLIAEKSALRTSLQRTSILSNEKYRGIRIELAQDKVSIQAHNSEHEEAQDELDVRYSGSHFEVGFNVQYLLDVLNVLQGHNVGLDLKDGNSSALIFDADSQDAKYVVMPMRI